MGKSYRMKDLPFLGHRHRSDPPALCGTGSTARMRRSDNVLLIRQGWQQLDRL